MGIHKYNVLVIFLICIVCVFLNPTAAAMSPKACTAGAGDFYPPEVTPGLYAQHQGLRALRHHDPRYAIDRLKVAAAWGSKVAEYNLGLMAWLGDDEPTDHPLAVAWLALADERHNSAKIDGILQFAYAKLTPAQHQQADADFDRMLRMYGDAVALKRARDTWRQAARSQTGSHVGASGDLSGGAGIDVSALRCNPYWPYPLKEQLTGNSKVSAHNNHATSSPR